MADRNDRRRVYLFFQFRNGWQCQFLEPDLASRQALDQAIAKGRGGVFLNLTQEQYERLRRPR